MRGTNPVPSGKRRIVVARHQDYGFPETAAFMATAPPDCKRCHRPVAEAAYDYAVMEEMHYVCFHYEFEHGTTDVDVDCRLPGCPAAALSHNANARRELPAPVAALRRFTASATSAFGYHREHDDMIVADLDLATTMHGPPQFKFLRAHQDNGYLVAEFEWLSPSHTRALLEDLNPLMATVCQEASFVQRRMVGDTCQFLVVTATPGDEDPPHGHVFRLDIKGVKVTPDLDADILGLLKVLDGVDKDTANHVQEYIGAGEHGLALTHLVAWVLRTKVGPDVAARLFRLVEVGGYPEDRRALTSYLRDLP